MASRAASPGPPIEMRGIRVNNLDGVDVRIPRRKMTVITGVSGSGKSSLAFDTLFAEGRRRYVECLSTYTRQFLDRVARPDFDSVSGLPPAIAFERAVPATQARSTVGTTTEVADYLRLLFARVGRTWCAACDLPAESHSPGEAAERLSTETGTGLITFRIDPPSTGARGWSALREALERDGFVRLLRRGKAVRLERARYASGEVEVVADRIRLGPGARNRAAEAIETAYRRGRGVAWAHREKARKLRFSRAPTCPRCGDECPRPEPRSLSPNSPLGACDACRGFGRSIGPDLARIIPDPGRTLAEGAVDPWTKPSHRGVLADLRRAGRTVGLRWDVPYRDLPASHRAMIEEGGHGFYGISGFFERLERKTYKVQVRVFLARYRAYTPCTECGGSKLNPRALAVRLGGRSIADVSAQPIDALEDWLRGLEFSGSRAGIAAPLLAELTRRVGLLSEVGLGYLTLERTTRTLSGGEAQRIQLARSLGSALVDTLYVLDEPSVGLHPQDVERLLRVLRRLRDAGNTVVVVEHDPRVMRESDWLIDMGPGAGEEGGRVLYSGPPAGIGDAPGSSTARYLVSEPAPRATPRRAGTGSSIELLGAATHNLKRVDVRLPRRAMTVVTGVSGSGKSSLIHDTLYPALRRALGGAGSDEAVYRELRGADGIAGVDRVDQSPIGRSPRSNPVTYVRAFDGIRKRFAETRRGRALGLKPGFFSFNVAGGRCEACEGAGSVTVEMHFLPDLFVTCEVCGGTRYGSAALEVRDRGLTIAEVLRLTVRQAAEHYRDLRDVARKLRGLDEIGLGYLRLGQPAPTLSGGEAQRLKLAGHLSRARSGERVLLLDEPTTGLHPEDVRVLLDLLRRLVEANQTIVVVEHHRDVVLAADHVVDLGPGAGEAGGRIVAAGPPGELARGSGSTARFLADSTPGDDLCILDV